MAFSPEPRVPDHATVFRDPAYVSAFTQTRPLPESTLAAWCRHVVDLAAELGGENPVVADLGCGAGRFSIPLSRMLPEKGRVVAVDNSETMLALLNNAGKNASPIIVMRDDIAEFTPPSPLHVCFLSEVLHSIPVRLPLFQHLNTICANEAAVVVRIASHEQLKQMTWLEQFPNALGLDQRRSPDIPQLVEELRASGFTGNVTMRSVNESLKLTPKEYLSALEAKAFSTLRMLPEKDYRSGLTAAREFAEHKEFIEMRSAMTCLTVRKGRGLTAKDRKYGEVNL